MSRIVDIDDFENASSGSIVRLLPLSDDVHPYFADYDSLVLAVDALVTRSPLHLSGPSGSGKSHCLNSLLFGSPDSFSKICSSLGLPRWRNIKCHRIYVSTFETPAEVWYKTEVSNFSTEERPQRILEILKEASEDPETLHVIWLVESGRGITESVQGAFLEIVGQTTIREPHGERFEAVNVTFCTDSNHAANEGGEFAIWDLDQAYGRRWTRRLAFSGLDEDQETLVMSELAPEATQRQVEQVTALAAAIRRKHSEAALQSVLPPTIDAELDLLGCLGRLPVDARSLVYSTLLGFCSDRDQDEAETIYATAFGVQVKTDTPAAEAVGVL